MTATYPETLSWFVYGLPIPQGSKSARISKGRANMFDQNKKLPAWRKRVKAHAKDAAYSAPLLTGPVAVSLAFTFERPKSHYRSGAYAHLLRDNAPPYPTTRGTDIDKLVRAILDSITDAKVWRDDVQVVELRRVRKVWAGEHEYALPQAGVRIQITPLGDPTL